MQIADLAAQIQEMQRRVTSLQQAASSGLQQQTVLDQVFEELHSSLEELRSVEEELLRQNAELLAVQAIIAAEQQRYQDLFDFAPDGYLLTTPSGLVEEANHAACRMLHIDRAELLGKPLPFFVAEDHRSEFRVQLGDLRATGRTQAREIEIQPRNAPPFIAALTITPVYDRAQHLNAIRWSIRDVTERRLSDQQIRRLNAELEQRVAERTAELEAANRQKDELLRREQQARRVAEDALKVRDAFLTTASHELKTPLTSLIGYVYLLQHGMAGRDDVSSKEQAALRVIMDQSQRLNQLIEVTLDLAHLQEHRVGLQLRPLDITRLTQDVVAEFNTTLSRHAIQLTIEEQPLIVDGDVRRLQQVLHNLLQNAVKYSPHGGAIQVQVWRHEAEARLLVRDQGIGVPDAAQSKIFDRFYRADNFNHLQISGFGIGLYIVQEILALHGGHITVSPNDGPGSTFDVALPLSPPGESLPA